VGSRTGTFTADKYSRACQRQHNTSDNAQLTWRCCAS